MDIFKNFVVQKASKEESKRVFCIFYLIYQRPLTNEVKYLSVTSVVPVAGEVTGV